MQETDRKQAGLLIGLHRRERLRTDPAGGWTQDQFILEPQTHQPVCSRMTLYKLEQGQGIQDEEKLELLLRRLGEKKLTDEQQRQRDQTLIRRLRTAYDQYAQDEIRAVLDEIRNRPVSDQILIHETGVCMQLIAEHLIVPEKAAAAPIVEHYRRFDAGLKAQVAYYLAMAEVLDEDLFEMMIATLWQINVNQWSDRSLSELLLEKLDRCQSHSPSWLARKGAYLSALNRRAEALDCFNQVLAHPESLSDCSRAVTEMLRFRIWKQLDRSEALRSCPGFEKTLSTLPMMFCAQGWMELGLCLCESCDYSGVARIEKALEAADYLALYYLPHLFRCPLDHRRILALAKPYLDRWTTAGTLAVYRYYQARLNEESPAELQQRILKEILPLSGDTLYRPQELIPILHDELLELVQKTGSYKGLADFELVTKKQNSPLIREMRLNV